MNAKGRESGFIRAQPAFISVGGNRYRRSFVRRFFCRCGPAPSPLPPLTPPARVLSAFLFPHSAFIRSRMPFLRLSGKTFLVTGVANKKSVAWHIAKTLEEEGAKVVYAVRSPARRESLAKLLGDKPVYICDVEREEETVALAAAAGPAHGPFSGFVHSIAFANYSEGLKPFHETKRADFLQATSISCFSLVELARAFKPYLTDDASVVSIGISAQVTAASYGYMS